MEIEPTNGDGSQDSDRRFPNWRTIVSAWAVVFLFAIVFALFYAFSPSRSPPQKALHEPLVIPKYQPRCAPVGSPTNLEGCSQQPSESAPPLPPPYAD